MDIVYVVGSGSLHNDIELRMSLRSICKYGRNVGKVIVAGKPPDWLSKEAVQVCVGDDFDYKHNNILKSLKNVVDKGLVSGDFLYSSDDHFYLKRVDFGKYPVFKKQSALPFSVEDGDSCFKYHKSLVDTRSVLESNGLCFENYSQHCNTHFNTESFSIFGKLIETSYTLPFGTEPTSLMMNAWMSIDSNVQPIVRSDAKLSRPYDTEEEIRQKIGDRHCFSIGDGIFNGNGIIELFQREYPDKCIFEL